MKRGLSKDIYIPLSQKAWACISIFNNLPYLRILHTRVPLRRIVFNHGGEYSEKYVISIIDWEALRYICKGRPNLRGLRRDFRPVLASQRDSLLQDGVFDGGNTKGINLVMLIQRQRKNVIILDHALESTKSSANPESRISCGFISHHMFFEILHSTSHL